MESETNVLSVLDVRPIIAWPYPRILVGILPERAMSHFDETFFPFMKLAAQGPALIETKYGRQDVVRNHMVKVLLQSTYTHVLMLDLDHNHPEDIVQRLARWVLLFPEIKIVSGLNFRRKAPYDPVAGNLTVSGHRPIMYEWDQGLLAVDEVGGASLLVDRVVFETIEPPWFFNDYSKAWENNWPGEDIGFCTKSREAGFKIYVDTTTSSPHATTQMVTEKTFRKFIDDHEGAFRYETV